MATQYRIKSFAESLEEQFAEDSEKLANVHLEAAINAQLDDISFDDDDETDKHDNPEISTSNPLNCYSPYVPTCAKKIDALIDFVNLSYDDVFLDLGCGDGRVCLVASQRMLQSSRTLSHGQPRFRAIGIDVSSDCIAMAKQIYATTQSSLVDNDGSSDRSIAFYQADLTVDTGELLSDPRLSEELRSATIVYLYTYPTLLVRLVPLLARLFEFGRLRAVVTLTYHLHGNAAIPSSEQWTAELERVDTEHDLCLYKNIGYKTESQVDIP